MENLNAEQIKKALECCSSSDGVFACESGCPYWGGDYDTCPCTEEPNFIIKNALALINSQEQRIKELTEKNERLNATKYYMHSDGKIEVIPSVDSVRADTIKKMQERLKADAVTIQDHTGKLGVVVGVGNIDDAAREMLEGENGY